MNARRAVHIERRGHPHWRSIWNGGFYAHIVSVEQLPTRRSVKSQSFADFPIGSRSGPSHHSATAKEYYPSSSAAARHSAILHDTAAVQRNALRSISRRRFPIAPNWGRRVECLARGLAGAGFAPVTFRPSA
jgi:hypothetical protein